MGLTWKAFKEKLTTPGTVSFQDHDQVRKFACLFAGLGHLQPLLLATTNSHYLLDRFCMERCCSGEYISRIVTSLIFMEILSIIVVRITMLIIFKYLPDWLSWTNRSKWTGDDAKGDKLNNWNEDEEKIRGMAGSIILCLIQFGYVQIFYAFTSGGKKGHMHWFYFSLLIQHFLNSLIAGSIGFWEVGLALWYLVTLPMAPIIIFFYQLIIHSWIRNNGPCNIEYLVVEYQIVLATAISVLAVVFWIIGYFISYYPIELEIQGLNNTATPASTDDIGRITPGSAQAITLAKTTTGQPVQSASTQLGGSVQVKTVELNSYSANLVTATMPGGTNKYATVNLTAGLEIQFKSAGDTVQSVEVESATKTGKPTLKYTGSSTPKVYSTRPKATVQPDGTKKSVDISLTVEEITISSSSPSTNITQVIVTIPVNVKVAEESAPKPVPKTITSVILKLPVPTDSATNKQLTIGTPGYSGQTLEITVQAAAGNDGTASVNEVTGYGFTPNKGYCIYSVREGGDTARDIWTAGGGKCLYATCYKKTTGSNNGALLVLYLGTGGTPERKFFGKDTDWYEINKKTFYEKLPAFAANGQLSGLDGENTDQYNRVYHPNSWWSHTMAPLLMQGLSVGAVGSIFPNLIPKTLTCPKTTRNLSVINMFLVTVPHIFNVMLGDNDVNPASKPWTWYDWNSSLFLYLFYILAILFAIFNIHYPEWRLSCFLRNNTLMVFLMILFTDVLNETFNAISRAGICSQKAAGGGDKKNHPCLHNKIACLMNLTYIPHSIPDSLVA